MNKVPVILVLLVAHVSFAWGTGVSPQLADRVAIERVYHRHRTGTKQSFEEAMPSALLEKLVREDAKKEAVLGRAYGMKITPEILAAEVRRIDTTTRAPEILAEIKAALGNDPERFANSFAKPIIVERELRQRFDNDDALHALQRRAAETVRDQLLALKEGGLETRFAVLKESGPKAGGKVQEQVTWQLTPRPASEDVNDAMPSGTASAPVQAANASSDYTNEATAQLAQVLSSPEKGGAEQDRKFYFEDLPAELQNVLRVQLREPGDVSAVIEMPTAFLLYLAKERTEQQLSVAVLTIPKRSYEEWLNSQPDMP